MPKKKDAAIIGVVLLLAVALFAVSKMMPKTDLSTKTADVTLAPDAVEYLDETPAPEATAEPQPTEAPEITAEPTAEATAEPQPTEAPEITAEPTAEATAEPQPTEAPEMTAEPTAAPESANMIGPVMPKQTDKVRGYVVITVAGRQYGDPIPMDRDKIITIKQDNGEINKIHITPEYVVMESSTCENQDCIGEGEVNVNTYKDRILSTYIICLPNQVTIEMVPADE